MGFLRPSRRYNLIRYGVLFLLFTAFGVTALFQHAWMAAIFCLVVGAVCGLLFLHDLPTRPRGSGSAGAPVEDENHELSEADDYSK